MKSQTPKATDTRCPVRDTPRSNPCRGDLVRADDGADRLSEHNGRIVLVCRRCETRWSVPIETGEFKTYPKRLVTQTET